MVVWEALKWHRLPWDLRKEIYRAAEGEEVSPKWRDFLTAVCRSEIFYYGAVGFEFSPQHQIKVTRKEEEWRGKAEWGWEYYYPDSWDEVEDLPPKWWRVADLVARVCWLTDPGREEEWKTSTPFTVGRVREAEAIAASEGQIWWADLSTQIEAVGGAVAEYRAEYKPPRTT
jgi:hypothetical protein